MLHILFVEDDSTDRLQIARELTEYFVDKKIEAVIDEKDSFESGFAAIDNPNIRYDLVITDTYKGDHKDRNAAVLHTVQRFRAGKFAPIIVCSSGECPAELDVSTFVNWVDKSGDHLLTAVGDILDLGLPQLARSLHDELDKAAGNYLWQFLEDEWEELQKDISAGQLERIIRRRAALAISDLMPGSDKYVAVPQRYGLEYYIYPNFAHDHYSLGDIIVNKTAADDIRVILTPHCHLAQCNADYVLTAKTLPVANVLGEKLTNAKGMEPARQTKKLEVWSRSPAQTERKPEGRHWYLPKFLRIPHLFVDFLQTESVKYNELTSQFDRIATLAPPYAEALQACFSGFYASVGIPVIDPESIKDMLD